MSKETSLINLSTGELYPSEFIESRGISEIILAPESDLMFSRDFTIGHLKPYETIQKIFGKFFLIAKIDIGLEELGLLSLEIVDKFPDLKISDIILIARKGSAGALCPISWGTFRFQDILAPAGWVVKYIELKDTARAKIKREEEIKQDSGHHERVMKALQADNGAEKRKSINALRKELLEIPKSSVLSAFKSEFSNIYDEAIKGTANPLKLPENEFITYAETMLYKGILNSGESGRDFVEQLIKKVKQK